MTETIICPPDHLHNGTCYGTHGCRCATCTEHKAAIQRTYRRNRAYGRPTMVDAAPIRRHIRKLQRFGIGIPRLAELTGVDHRTLGAVVYGRRSTSGKFAKPSKVSAKNAAAILAIAAVPENRDERVGGMNARGAHRRIQALVAAGWSFPKIGAHMGVGGNAVAGTLHRPRISRALHLRIAAAFDDLWDQKPPLETPWDRVAYIRTVNMASARGWVPAAAWNDIDTDPRPASLKRYDSTVDDVAVELAVKGEHVNLNPAERREVVRQLHARRWSDPAIEAHTGIDERTVLRIRQELDLPGWDMYQQRHNLQQPQAA